MLDESGKRTCSVGGYRADNGCPSDHPFSPESDRLSTTCLAISDNATAAVGDDFHCLLSCDRGASQTTSDPADDAACPGDSVCAVGPTRLRHVGVCVYV